jgi:hypothetical protein
MIASVLHLISTCLWRKQGKQQKRLTTSICVNRLIFFYLQADANTCKTLKIALFRLRVSCSTIELAMRLSEFDALSGAEESNSE